MFGGGNAGNAAPTGHPLGSFPTTVTVGAPLCGNQWSADFQLRSLELPCIGV